MTLSTLARGSRGALAGLALGFVLAGGDARAADAPMSIIAELNAAPANAAKLKAVLIPLAEAARREPGCVSYTLLEAPAKPGQFFTYEVWASQGAFAAHMKGPAIGAAGAALASILLAPPAITQLSSVP